MGSRESREQENVSWPRRLLLSAGRGGSMLFRGWAGSCPPHLPSPLEGADERCAGEGSLGKAGPGPV